MVWEDTGNRNSDSQNHKFRWYFLEGVDARVKCCTFTILIISIGIIIAGSVMFSIGISKSLDTVETTTAIGHQTERTVEVSKTTLNFVSTLTPHVGNSISRDVIILVDCSNAMKSGKNFNTVKSWIVSTLFPLWTIDKDHIQIAFATYSDEEFNILLNFDKSTIQEVSNVVSSQMYSGEFAPSVTNGLSGAVDIQSIRQVRNTVIIISASENEADIKSAMKYSRILSTPPNQLITVALDSTTSGKSLGVLSNNSSLYFGSPGFYLNNDIARKISNIVLGNNNSTKKSF